MVRPDAVVVGQVGRAGAGCFKAEIGAETSLRAAAHLYNTREELTAFRQALRELLG